MRYLDSLLKTLPAVQARQITDILSDLQTKGQITSLEDYQNKLQELGSVVNDINPTPSFVQIKALVWQLCRSQAYNKMLQAAKNDVVAAFSQVKEIGEKVEDHNYLFVENLLQSLEKSILDKEAFVKKTKWLHDQNNEFNKALVDTFLVKNQTERNSITSATLFFNNRTFKQTDKALLPDAVIDTKAGKLLLDANKDNRISPANVIIESNFNSYQTQQDVNLSELKNVIDQKPNTYWVQDTYLEKPVDKVDAVLKFSFDGGRDISYIAIESGSSYPIKITKIEGVTPSSNIMSLFSGSEEVLKKKKIFFDKALVKDVIVTFSVSEYRKANYYVDTDSLVNDVFINPSNVFDRIHDAQKISSVVKKALQSENIAKICNVSEKSGKAVDAYVYSLSLDNIYFGNPDYKNSGVFVSRPMRIKNPGILSVFATDNSDVYGCSIEYDLIRSDSRPKQKNTILPVPKYKQTSVVHERLLLSSQENSSTLNDVGFLRFCPMVPFDWDLREEKPVKIYKNGQEIYLGTDWRFAISKTGGSFDWRTSFIHARDFDDYKLFPTRMYILIESPDLNAVYTVSYTIRNTQKDKIVWMDKDKNSYLTSSGILFIEDSSYTESQVYLQATLRTNDKTTIPTVDEFSILGNSYK